MGQYIDKAALIAEIERRIKTNKECMLGLRNLDYYQGKVDALKDTLSSLDTHEVKGVDLDFEQELYKSFGQVKDFTLGMRIAKRFYEIGRNYQGPVSEEQVKELTKTQHVNEMCQENGNSLTQEPVSIDFEQELYKAFGQVKDFTLSMRIAKWFYDMGKNSQEPVSEELEKEIDSYFAKWLQGSSDEGCFNPDSQLVSIYDCHRIARHFANWQKQKNKSKVLTEEQCRKIRDDAFELGKDAMKQKMMAKAVDATVHSDAGGYPCIPQMELYDYEKDIPFAKEGDKYKVILIKEDLL